MYLVNQPNDAGHPSQFPAFSSISHNMMVANYQSQEAVDNDDGSGFYHTHHNFLVYVINSLPFVVVHCKGCNEEDDRS